MKALSKAAAVAHTQGAGFLGLFFVGVGAFAPPIAEHLWPHLKADTIAAIKDFSRYLEAFGGLGAYFGRGALSQNGVLSSLRSGWSSPAAEGAALADKERD